MTSTNSDKLPDKIEENEVENNIETGNALRETRIRKRTEKGLLMDIEKAKKKRDKVAGTVNMRIKSACRYIIAGVRGYCQIDSG